MEAARTYLEDIARYFVGPADPREQLDVLDRDQREVEAEIRAVLDRLAESISLAIGDMSCEPEADYLEEIDLKPTV